MKLGPRPHRRPGRSTSHAAEHRIDRPPVPLGVWAAALSATAVVGEMLTTGAVVRAAGRLDAAAVVALGAGLAVGLLLSLLSSAAAGRLAAALRAVGLDRREDGSAGRRRRSPGLSRELADLAHLVDTLTWRVRQAEELAERRRAEADLAAAGVQELVSGLVAAEEDARGQLAAELHDTVAQSLMLARGLLASQPTSPFELAQIGDHVEDAEEQVRAVMARTRPPALRDGDLADAVGGLRDDFRARYGLEVHVSWPAAPVPLPLAAAVTLYRFFQEALLNVVKHADVEQVQVALEVHPDGVVATVRDDGPGFEPDQVRPDRGRHVGLGLLAERARLSGGRLQVDSGSGSGRGGTLVRLELPRPAPDTARPGIPAPGLAVPGVPVPGIAVPAQRTAGALPTVTSP